MGEATVKVPDGLLHVEWAGNGPPVVLIHPGLCPADRGRRVGPSSARVRVCRVLADGIPDARMVQIPRTDHVVNMREPAGFNRMVLDFLREVR